MKKASKILIITLSIMFLIIISLTTVVLIKNNNSNNIEINNNSKKNIDFFYLEKCPHCHDMILEIKEKNYDNNYNINYREVSKNQKNKEDFVNFAKSCNLDLKKLGVPFVKYNDKCYVGVLEIRELFISLGDN